MEGKCKQSSVTAFKSIKFDGMNRFQTDLTLTSRDFNHECGCQQRACGRDHCMYACEIAYGVIPLSTLGMAWFGNDGQPVSICIHTVMARVRICV